MVVVDRLSAQLVELQAECKTLSTERSALESALRENEQRRTALEAELASARTQQDGLCQEREQLNRTTNAIAQRAILAEHKVVEARFRHEALSNESDRLGKELTFTLDRAAAAGQDARSAQEALEKDLKVVREHYAELSLRAEALAGELDLRTGDLDTAKTDNLRLSQKLDSVLELETLHRAKCSQLEAELVAARSERDAFSQETISLATEVSLRSTDVANLQTTLLEERARLNQREAELNAANEGNQQLAGKLEAVAREEAAYRAKCSELETALIEARGETEKLSRKMSLLDSELQRSSRDFARSEKALSEEQERAARLQLERDSLGRRIMSSASLFAAAFEERIGVFRGQRAWRIMLAVRKAYALSMRGGWSGRFESLRIPFQLVSGAPDVFADQDLAFPEIWSYLPDANDRPDDPGGSLAAGNAQSLPVRRFDLVVLAIFDFEFRYQRPQQIAARFARAGHRVFWVSPSRRPSSPDREFEVVLLRENLWEVRLAAAPFNLFEGALEQAQVDNAASGLRHLYRDLAVSENVAFVQFPFWRQIALSLRAAFGTPVIYDCMDDWRNWSAEPRISDFSLSEEAKLAGECDLLVATSAELSKRLETQSGRVALRIRNAADWDFFRSADENSLLTGLPRPIVGYYGAIADWVDVALMTELAAMRPQYSFVFIGENHAQDISRLQRLPNVRLLGEKNYRLIPSYLHGFDACLLPFMMNDLTRAVDPVKVYEYLSQGKPVIATPLAELQDHGDVLYLASTAAEFADQLDRALTEDCASLRNARIAFAQENSWSARVHSLDAAISEVFPLVSILVVSYNCGEYLGPCIDSILRNTSYPRYELIVVDNNSSDGSRDILASRAASYPQLRFLCLEKNLGFAAGNNVAAREARGDYLILLNADTIVTWGWVERLMRPFRANPETGMTAPVTNFSGNETKINVPYRGLGEMEEFALECATRHFGQTTDLGMVPLLCAMMPRRIWDEIGELDEGFGIGMFEDDDFSLRIRKAGYRLLAVDDCFIHHFGNGSFAKLPPAEALDIFNSNRTRFERKWNIEWKGHQTRPGVRPASDLDRIPLAQFLASAAVAKPGARSLVLRKLLPAEVHAGEAANKQPDGGSAIVVECENAVPGTVVRYGELLLHTSYGHQGMLSALLPSDFNATPGRVPVSLVDDIGCSNTLDFTVRPAS